MLHRLKPLNISKIAIIAVAVCAPFPVGSQDMIWVALWGFLLSLFILPPVVQHTLRPAQLSLVVTIFVLLVLFAVILYLQSVRDPVWFSSHPIWEKASQALGKKLVSYASVNPWQILNAAGPSLLCALSAICGVFIAACCGVQVRVLRYFAYASAIYAVLAIILFFASPDKIFWEEKQAHIRSLTGTFRNRNTAAAFFGFGCHLWLALLILPLRSYLKDQMTGRDLLILVFFRRSLKLWATGTGLLVCLLAVFMTGSRAGVLLTLGTMGVLAFLMLRPTLPRWPGVALIIFAGVIILSEIFGVKVAQRIAQEGFSDGYRWETYKICMEMIRSAPWLGMGLGTFAEVFPAWRTPDLGMIGTWHRAHNTLLEIAVEMGLPLALSIAVSWIWITRVMISKALRSPQPLFSALSASLLIMAGLHSLVDYPLQIPGLAIFYFTLVGYCVSASLNVSTGVAGQNPVPAPEKTTLTF